MKAYNINCPNCGGNINLEKDVQRCFCPYCGSQVHIDDGVQRSEISYRDEAKILELQLQEQARLRAVEAEVARQSEYARRRKRRLLLFALIAVAFIVSCVVLIISKREYILVMFFLSFFVPMIFPYSDDGTHKNVLVYFALWSVIWLLVIITLRIFK